MTPERLEEISGFDDDALCTGCILNECVAEIDRLRTALMNIASRSDTIEVRIARAALEGKADA